MVEYGWGARSIDPATWQAYERKEGPSLWGHERSWLPEKERNAAREMRMQLAARRRAPAGAGDRGQLRSSAPGVCPWWDAVKHQQKSA